MIIMKKRRNQIELIVDILKIIRYDKLRTHILLKVNMSYVQLRIYLDLLIKLKLIRMSTNNELYITDNGRTMIEILGE